MSVFRASWMSFVTVFCVAAGPGTGTTIVENFEGPSGNGGFTDNPVFVHDIGRDEILGVADPVFEFSTVNSISPTHSLHLLPGTDFVTFALAPDEFVDSASVWMAGANLSLAVFHIIGIDEMGQPLDIFVQSNPDDTFVFASTEGLGFAQITELRLTSAKSGLFDDLTINVAPEPATISLLAVGLLGLLRSRRRTRAH